MPITDELNSMKKLEAAGFSHDQAQAVVEAIESGVQHGFDRFVQVLDQRLADMEGRLRLEIQTLRSEILKEQRDQILRFAALVTLIVAVIGGVYRFF